MADIRMTKSGIILLNKPAGISSNQAVNKVKYAIGAKKCGHLGTLDLEGEGLLLVTVNSATKLFDYFLKKQKTYETIFVFGKETDTLDMSGEIVKTDDCHITREMVEKKLPQMIGKYAQMPPQFSAKKVGGKVAYLEARKGKTVELQPKEIEIFDFKLLEQIKENVFKFEVTCSSGTYIRSLARDLAKKLSTYGSMQCILRTRCGKYNLEDAYTIEDVKNGDYSMISCEDVFDYEKLFLSLEDSERVFNGQIIDVENSDGLYRIFSDEDFMGVGKIVSKKLTLCLRLM